MMKILKKIALALAIVVPAAAHADQWIDVTPNLAINATAFVENGNSRVVWAHMHDVPGSRETLMLQYIDCKARTFTPLEFYAITEDGRQQRQPVPSKVNPVHKTTPQGQLVDLVCYTPSAYQ